MTETLWLTRLLYAGVPKLITDRIYKRYGSIPGWLVEEMIRDDGRAGIGPINLDKTHSSRFHDWAMLLSKRGYPVMSNGEIQARYAAMRTAEGIVAGLQFAATPIYVALGAGVGYAIGAWRDLF